MMKPPAHKNVEHPAGQVRNETTLADYIHRTIRNDAFEASRMTFEEWFAINNLDDKYKSTYRYVWESAIKYGVRNV